jgi:hypothetical protein
MSVNEPISNSEGCPEIKLTSSISAQSNQDLHLQINHLKENAHQSFMQVMYLLVDQDRCSSFMKKKFKR